MNSSFQIIAKVKPDVSSLQTDLNVALRKNGAGGLQCTVRPTLIDIESLQTQLNAQTFTINVRPNLQQGVGLGSDTGNSGSNTNDSTMSIGNALRQADNYIRRLRTLINQTKGLSLEQPQLEFVDRAVNQNGIVNRTHTLATEWKNARQVYEQILKDVDYLNGSLAQQGGTEQGSVEGHFGREFRARLEAAQQALDILPQFKTVNTMESHFDSSIRSASSLLNKLDKQISSANTYRIKNLGQNELTQELSEASSARAILQQAVDRLNSFKDARTGAFKTNYVHENGNTFTQQLEEVDTAITLATESLTNLDNVKRSFLSDKGVSQHFEKQFQDASKVVTKVAKQVDEVRHFNNKGVNDQNIAGQIEKTTTAYNNLQRTLSGLNSFRSESGAWNISQEDFDTLGATLNTLSSQVKTVQNEWAILQKLQHSITSKQDGDKYATKQINAGEALVRKLNKQIDNASVFNKKNGADDALSSEINKAEQVREKLSSAVALLKQFKTQGSQAFDISNKDFTDELAKLPQLIGEADRALVAMSDTQRKISTDKVPEKIATSWSGLTAKVSNLMAMRGSWLKQIAPDKYAELNQLYDKIKSTPDSDKSQSLIRDYGTQFNQLNDDINVLLNKGDTVLGRLSNLFNNRFSSLIASIGILQLISLIKQLKDNTIALESSLAQLEIVTGKSGLTLQSYFDNAAKSAKELGKLVTDILSSMETYARLGYNADQSAQMARTTVMMSNVGDMTTDSATKGMTSITKAYGIKAEESERIGDILTTVGKKYAISASELSEALENGGSALEAANNSLEQSVAIAAAGNASVQDASKVGNALKTTSMRIRGASAELSDMGEEVDELVESTPKLRKEIMALSGVDIMTDANTFKSTYDILLEIANAWDNISDVSRAALLEDLAGKRNANVIKSIITNVDDLKGAYEAALNSEGNLARDNAIYMDTAQAKLNQLTSAFQVFSAEFLSSSAFGGVVGILTSIVNGFTDLTKTIGSLGTVITTISLITLIKQFASWRTHGELAGGILKTIIDLVKGLSAASQAGATGITALSTAVVGLSAAEKASAILAIVSIIATVGSVIYTTIQQSNRELEESIQKVKDLNAEFQDTIKSSNENRQGLKTLKSNGTIAEFEALQKGVSKTGENLTLTNDQYQRYSEICEQIIGYCPELEEGYNSATSSLSAQNNVLEKAIELLNKKQQAEAKALFKGDNIKSMGLGAVEEYNDTVDELESAKKHFDEVYGNLQVQIAYELGDKSAGPVADTKAVFDSLGLSAYYNPSNYDSEMDMVYSVFTEHWDEVKTKISDYATSHSASDTDLSVWAKGLTDKLEPFVTAISEGTDKIEEAKKNLNDDLLAALYSVSDWYGLDTGVQGLLGTWVTNSSDFDVSKLASMSDSEIEATVKQWYNEVTEMVKNVSDNKKLSKAIEGILNLDPKSVSASDYATSVDEYVETIKTAFQDKLSEEDIKLKFGIEDFDSKIVKQQINRLKKVLSKDSSKEAVDKYIAGLSYSDLQKAMAAFNSDVSEPITNIKSLNEAIAELNIKELYESLGQFKSISEGIDNIQSAYNSVYTALADYKTTGVLTIDNLQKLLELNSDYIDILVNEDGQLQINQDTLKKLTIARLEEYRAKLISSTVDDINNIQTQAQARNILANATKDHTAALKSYAEAQLATAYANAQLKDEQENTNVYTEAAKVKLTELYKITSLLDGAITGVNQDLDASLKGTSSVTNAIQNSIKAIDKQTKALQRQKKPLEEQKQFYQDKIDAQQELIDTLQEEVDLLKKQEEALSRQKTVYDDDSSAIENLIELTADYIKQGYQDKIEAIDKSSEALKKEEEQTKKNIEAQKKKLNAEKEAYEWQKNIRDKNNAVTRAQQKVDAYSFDDSSQGLANLRNARNDLVAAIADRDDELFSHNISSRTEALDELQEKLDESYDKRLDSLDKEKEKIQKVVNNEVKLRKEAARLIKTRGKSLYKKLKAYASQYTTKTTSEVKDIWKKGNKALNKYNDGQTDALGILNNLRGKSINLGDAIDKNKAKQQNLNDKISELQTPIKNWNKKIRAIDKKTKSIDRTIDKLKDKQDVLNDKLTTAQDTTTTIASNMTVAADKAKDFIKNLTKKSSNITGYKIKFGSTVYKVKSTNWREAAEKLQQAISENHGGMMMVDTQYVAKHMKSYASGSKHTVGGVSIVDENGYEYKLNKLSSGHYQALQEGSVIFNKKMTDNLIQFSSSPDSYLRGIPNVPNASQGSSHNKEVNNNVTTNVTVQGDVTDRNVQRLVNEVSKKVIAQLIAVNSNIHR